MEPEFYKMAPEGVSIHTARIGLKEVRAEALKAMAEEAAEAAELLSTAGTNLIVYGCTTGSLLGGVEWERRLMEKVQENGRTPSFSTASAVVEALREFEAKKIVVATPYIEELNTLEKNFLGAHGFEVLEMKGLGLVSNLDIGREPPSTAYRLVCEVFKTEADAVFISCTNLRTIEVIKALEADLGRPVVTSNQASMWKSLRTGGIRERIPGYGSLLEEHI
jgi:maleate isomerase